MSDFIQNLKYFTVLRMRKQGHKIWQAYMSSKEKVLDTTMAVVRQRLGIEPPYFSDVRTVDASQPKESFFMMKKNEKWQQSSPQEVNFRWNEIFYPWEKTPFPFSFDNMRPEMVGFPATMKNQRNSEKFTVVMMSFKRIESVCELLQGLNGLDAMDRVRITH